MSALTGTSFSADALGFPLGGTLIASPNRTLRDQLAANLPPDEGSVLYAGCGAEVLSILAEHPCSLLLLDRQQPDLDAEELAALIRRRHPMMEVVLVSSLGCADDRPEAESSLSAGWGNPTLEERATGDSALYSSSSHGSARVEALPGMVGNSQAMQSVYRMVRLVADRCTTVLLTGPSGSGKEVVARAVHQLSSRANRPFVVVNCAAIPEALLESELFGHSRGAFTGAVQSHNGRVMSAQGGTLFLDEIGDMPLSLQAKMLRFLEYKEVQRLGSSECLKVDVRVVAATNAHLPRLLTTGQFREDLFYRLAAFPVEIPGLAHRPEDVLPLTDHFLTAFARSAKVPRPTLSTAAMRCLQTHSWPGNVRELQHVIERALILAEGSRTLLPEHLHFPAFGMNGLAAAAGGGTR